MYSSKGSASDKNTPSMGQEGKKKQLPVIHYPELSAKGFQMHCYLKPFAAWG
jgi:hypothetical protein